MILIIADDAGEVVHVVQTYGSRQRYLLIDDGGARRGRRCRSGVRSRGRRGGYSSSTGTLRYRQSANRLLYLIVALLYGTGPFQAVAVGRHPDCCLATGDCKGNRFTIYQAADTSTCGQCAAVIGTAGTAGNHRQRSFLNGQLSIQ